MKIALGMEYDGGAFCGWQTQRAGCGVQDSLIRTIADFTGERAVIHCAGRTDAGVHAAMQIVHFESQVERLPSSWIRGLNARLSVDAAVLWARIVPSDFHARFSAAARRYQYALLNRPERAALLRTKFGWHHAPLNLEAMREAAAMLVGEHDFSAFRAAACQSHSPNRFLHCADIFRRGEFIVFDFRANSFLHRMARNIVAALIYVGMGSRPPKWAGELLESKRRCPVPPAMPGGLYFVGADYPQRFGLPSTVRNAPIINLG